MKDVFNDINSYEKEFVGHNSYDSLQKEDSGIFIPFVNKEFAASDIAFILNNNI